MLNLIGIGGVNPIDNAPVKVEHIAGAVIDSGMVDAFQYVGFVHPFDLQAFGACPALTGHIMRQKPRR